MKRRFSNLMAGLAAATSLVSMPLSAAGPTSAEIQNDAATPGDVLSYGWGLGNNASARSTSSTARMWPN